jgi:signal peptide peptidase SppA
MNRQPFRAQLSQNEPLAIHPKALDVMFAVNDERDIEKHGTTAIVCISGPLEHHRSLFWDSYDDIVERLEEAFADDEVTSVVMCIDSPGGDAAGATEAHRKIQRLKKQHGKKLFAYSDESMYSAAYAIGSAADEIWVPETGGVGSVGVICALMDRTEQNKKLGVNVMLLTTGARKADSSPDREITEDVVNAIQSRVDYLGDVFFGVVAKSRGLSLKKVAALEADCFMGQAAIDSGLADKLGDWYSFIEYVNANGGLNDVKSDGRSTPKTKGSGMKTLAQLKKERDAAAVKLSQAKSLDERKACFAVYESAVLAVSEMQAKTKYVKKTEERLTEEDEKSEDEETTDEEKSEEDDDGDDDESDDDDDGDEESAEDEKKEKAAARASALPASLSRKNVERLYATARKATGKVDISEVCGALEGMTSARPKRDDLEARLAKMEADKKRERVKAMLDKAKTDGKITKVEANGLYPQGVKDPKWLKGYLSELPKRFHSVEDGGFQGKVDEDAQSLDAQNLPADKKRIIEEAAMSAGMSVEDYTKQLQKYASKANGLAKNAPKY